MKEKVKGGGLYTEAGFTSFIRSALRRASSRWKPRTDVLKEARVEKGKYLCNGCKQIVPVTTVNEKGKRVKNVEVNHKIPVSLPGSWDSWDGFISRLFVEQEGLEVLCSECHKEHTSILRGIKEEWREIKGFTRYEISSFGRVKDGSVILPPNHYLDLFTNEGVYVNTVDIAALVAKTFIPNPHNKKNIRHKDGYNLNNFAHNLEWVD